MTPEELRSSWNRIASHYHTQFERPADDVSYGRLAPPESALRLLPNVAGMNVLDLGCGGGHNCIALTRMGARCTGVDISDEQVRWARIHAEQAELNIEFHQAELSLFVSTCPNDTYDMAISVFALPYVSNLGRLYREIHRMLKASGVFVLSVNHPLSDVAESCDGEVVIRKSYFEAGAEEWAWKGGDGKPVAPLTTYRRTFADLLNPLAAAGFAIELIAEPETVADESSTDQDLELTSRVPSTLICKARAVKKR